MADKGDRGGDVCILQDELQQAHSRLASLESDNESLARLVTRLRSEVATLKSTIGSESKLQASTVSRLQEQLASSQRQVAELEQQIETEAGEYGEILDRLEILRVGEESFATRVAELEEELARARETIRILESGESERVRAVERNLEESRRTVKALRAELTDAARRAEEAARSAQTELEAAQRRIERLGAERMELLEAWDGAEERASGLSLVLTELRSRYRALAVECVRIKGGDGSTIIIGSERDAKDAESAGEIAT